ncbi:MAG: DNA glycosylase AlkZ-like family protein [Acidimicrobiales bacterium]
MVGAAEGGLQDSAPRTALLSLHARVAEVRPEAWEAPGLVQVWGPRRAAYVVPEADVATFTLGRLPRVRDERRAIEALAAAALEALAGRTLLARELIEQLRVHLRHTSLRTAAASGRLLIRWDARLTWVMPMPCPRIDAEEARRQLARRFLHWLGPATGTDFARWAGVAPRDAAATWRALEPELVAVDIEGLGDGGERSALRADEAALRGSGPAARVRMLPPGDPYLALDRELLVSGRRRRDQLWALPDSRPRSPEGARFMPGAILSDGELVGMWGRQQARVTLFPWQRLARTAADAIDQEAAAMAGPLGRRISLRWVDP